MLLDVSGLLSLAAFPGQRMEDGTQHDSSRPKSCLVFEFQLRSRYQARSSYCW